MTTLKKISLLFALSGLLWTSVLGQAVSDVKIQVDKPGADISPTMFGIFFEDINFGADGGLYPERVKNRSFEFPEPMMAWQEIKRVGSTGTVSILTQDPINEENAHYLHFDVKSAGKGFGVTNEGFRGMGFQRGAGYLLTFYARNPAHAERAGNARVQERLPAALRVELEGADGAILARARLTNVSSQWKK
jgi:alpha-N-arabinofuranosidase